jgi:large subunit ribosomal protein L5
VRFSCAQAVLTDQKKAIAFKLRETPVGFVLHYVENECMLLDRLIHLALPRIRDFQGISPKVLMVQKLQSRS